VNECKPLVAAAAAAAPAADSAALPASAAAATPSPAQPAPAAAAAPAPGPSPAAPHRAPLRLAHHNVVGTSYSQSVLGALYCRIWTGTL